MFIRIYIKYSILRLRPKQINKFLNNFQVQRYALDAIQQMHREN